MIRPRFSLRWLLIFTALAAVACYWWIARPTILANRFAAAIHRRNLAAADNLCIDPNRMYASVAYRDFFMNLPYWDGAGGPYQGEMDVVVKPRTWDDLVRGQRRLEMTLSRTKSPLLPGMARVTDDPGDVIQDRFGKPRLPTTTDSLVATSRGIHPPPAALPIFTYYIE
jgi:hypothetical protein